MEELSAPRGSDPARRIGLALARANSACDRIETLAARLAMLEAAVTEAVEELDRIAKHGQPANG
jgi:hypothetical protein